jgi:hypothetical protein
MWLCGVSRWVLGPCSGIRKRRWFVYCVLRFFGCAKGERKGKKGAGASERRVMTTKPSDNVSHLTTATLLSGVIEM